MIPLSFLRLDRPDKSLPLNHGGRDRASPHSDQSFLISDARQDVEMAIVPRSLIGGPKRSIKDMPSWFPILEIDLVIVPIRNLDHFAKARTIMIHSGFISVCASRCCCILFIAAGAAASGQQLMAPASRYLSIPTIASQYSRGALESLSQRGISVHSTFVNDLSKSPISTHG